MEPAEGGAHVRMKKKCGVFIVPMCGKHNNAQNQDWYSVEENTIAVRVDEEDTSGPAGPCYLWHIIPMYFCNYAIFLIK